MNSPYGSKAKTLGTRLRGEDGFLKSARTGIFEGLATLPQTVSNIVTISHNLTRQSCRVAS